MLKRAACLLWPVASLEPSGATGSAPGGSGPKKKLSALLPTRAMPSAGCTATDMTTATSAVVAGGRARSRDAASSSAGGERRVRRGEQVAAAVVADGALTHLVHHVAEAHPVLEVDDRQRATPAAPEAGARVQRDRHPVDREAEADAVAQLDAEHQVDPVALLVEDAVD